TKWCGRGNRANSPDDLGIFEFTDDCCRHHDNCSDHIHVGETKHGLKNTGIYTRSHCDCDDAFYDCLKDDNSLVSLKLGNFISTSCVLSVSKWSILLQKAAQKNIGQLFLFRHALKRWIHHVQKNGSGSMLKHIEDKTEIWNLIQHIRRGS
ncbi:hypothetical protein L9F63_027619, partial [Diploptera punctata]